MRVKFKIGVILLLLALPAVACGLSNPLSLSQHQIRLAVYEYERATRGPTDQLIIHFRRDEPRFTFPGQNENGRRTVWVDNFGAGEYFDKLPPQTSYLYIQTIKAGDTPNTATATVYRGDGFGYEGYELSLTRGPDDQWQVTDETVIAAKSSGSE